jgi:hypothetical protein
MINHVSRLVEVGRRRAIVGASFVLNIDETPPITAAEPAG